VRFIFWICHNLTEHLENSVTLTLIKAISMHNWKLQQCLKSGGRYQHSSEQWQPVAHSFYKDSYWNSAHLYKNIRMYIIIHLSFDILFEDSIMHFWMEVECTCPHFPRKVTDKYSMNSQHNRNCTDTEQKGRQTEVNPKCSIHYTYTRHGLCCPVSMIKHDTG
jgi:hypothetical protein